MSNKVVRFSMLGMIGLTAALAFAGCLAEEGDELAVEGNEPVLGESSSEVNQVQAINIRNVTCNSGWPGTRGCHWTFGSVTDIVPGSIVVQINGRNGEVGHSVAQTGPRSISFSATVREGDAFNPGVNTTSYTVVWLSI